MSSLKGFDERERAAETLWFSKQEEKVLRNLLSKMKAQADKHDPTSKEVLAKESKALQEIMPSLSAEQVSKLLDWKHASF
jgi:hypothetical protein